jgi:DnaB-like helicase C terminal domain
MEDGKPNGGFLIPYDAHPFDYTKDANKPYYLSTFIYNESHNSIFKAKKTISGITDVTTDKIYWDFDSKSDLSRAQKDAVEICARLQSHGIPSENIQVSFSGSKGFGVEVKTNRRYTPQEVQLVASKMAEGLSSFDTSMYNPARVFRIAGTKHYETGLYKFPLTVAQLSELPVVEIKLLAKDMDNTIVDNHNWETVVKIPDSINELTKTATKDRMTHTTIAFPEDLDFTTKTKGFSNCKYALLNGFFPPGSRDSSMMALAATCRALGYPKEITYSMCKGAARLQGQRYASEPFDKKEIWKNVIGQVYGDNWKGAQYSCKTQSWLKEICDSLGRHKCNHTISEGFVEVKDMFDEFEDYSNNIEKNTIKTGLTSLDEKIQLTVGMPVGLLGAPSSGKTSIALNILNNTSNMGISSVFFSMDMYGPLISMKQIQKITGMDVRQIHDLFRHDKRKAAEIKEKISQEYKNVRFSTKAGHTVQEMRDIVNDYQDKTGDKVKLILTDYLECISGPYSDATANSSKIAGELRDFATEMSICGITLLQPPKISGDASYPLASMRQIKGSSMLEQSFRSIISIYREGFGPDNPEDDKFMTIKILKNTMGTLGSIDYAWRGQKGDILEISEEEAIELSALRSRKATKAKENNNGF